jgi:hypothetical protein
MTIDFGSKSMPFEIEAGQEQEFTVSTRAGAVGKNDRHIDFFVDAGDRLVVERLEFSILVTEQKIFPPDAGNRLPQISERNADLFGSAKICAICGSSPLCHRR